MGHHLPYLSIYKGDFLRGYVSALSISAQGLWLRLNILMHDSERTGYLSINGSPMPPKLIATKVGITLAEYEVLLDELMSVSAFQLTKDDILFSPQLVQEEKERQQNAERQRRHYAKQKGVSQTENKVNSSEKPNGKPNAQSNGDLTATSQVSSSSSSSSSSIQEKNGSGSSSYTRAREPDEPQAATATATATTLTNGNNRKRIVLTDEQKKMSREEFHTFLQQIYPDRNIPEVAAKLRKFCARTDLKTTVKPTRELLCEWLESERTVMDAEFLAELARGAPEEKPKTFVNAMTGKGFS